MRRLVGLVLGLAFLAALAASATAAPVVPATDSPSPDGTLITVDVDQRGDANWTITYRFRLDDANATAAFESFREDIRANRSRYERQFAERMRPTVAQAANTTGRTMAVTNVSATTSRQNLTTETGIVSYRFGWRSFAAVDGDRLRVGDAIDGLYLDRDTTLAIRAPDGMTVRSTTPEPDTRRSSEVRWSGPLSFGDGAPRVLMAPGPGTTATTPPSTAVGIGGVPWVPILALLIVVGGGAAVWYRRRDDGPPSDLLSDEERVRQLVETNDGRMKQAAIAEELDWTAAKTSRVVNGMQDEGDLEVFRIGRENVVALPDEDEPE
jgi:hypothetical protein